MQESFPFFSCINVITTVFVNLILYLSLYVELLKVYNVA